MIYATDLGLPEGPRILGHAIGHACADYGGRVDDYADIVAAALHGRHRAPATVRTVYSEYAVLRARQLITEADHLGSNHMLMAGWIGAATAILQELTRDA